MMVHVRAKVLSTLQCLKWEAQANGRKINNTFKSGGSVVNSNHNRERWNEHTGRENDGLDTVKESNAFATIPIETLPGGPRGCCEIRLGFDVVRIAVLDVCR